MSLFLLKRLAIFAATLAAPRSVVFLVLEVLPATRPRSMLGTDAHARGAGGAARQLGLDQPALAPLPRLGRRHAARRFRRSYTYGVPVAELVAERLAVTLPLALIAMALTTVIGARGSASTPPRGTRGRATSASWR